MKTIKNFKQLCSICRSNAVYSFNYDIQICEESKVVRFIAKSIICQSILEDVIRLGFTYSNFRYFVGVTPYGSLSLICYANFD